MDTLELMKYRRSIRRYTDRQVPEEDLLKILEAGAYAPNAGGGQRSRFVACQDRMLNEAIGKLNIARFDRSHLVGGFVSKEQPSIIDDPTIRSGFTAHRPLSRFRSEELSLFYPGCLLCCREYGNRSDRARDIILHLGTGRRDIFKSRRRENTV